MYTYYGNDELFDGPLFNMAAEFLVEIYSTGHEGCTGEVQEGEHTVAEEILEKDNKHLCTGIHDSTGKS